MRNVSEYIGEIAYFAFESVRTHRESCASTSYPCLFISALGEKILPFSSTERVRGRSLYVLADVQQEY